MSEPTTPTNRPYRFLAFDFGARERPVDPRDASTTGKLTLEQTHRFRQPQRHDRTGVSSGTCLRQWGGDQSAACARPPGPPGRRRRARRHRRRHLGRRLRPDRSRTASPLGNPVVLPRRPHGPRRMMEPRVRRRPATRDSTRSPAFSSCRLTCSSKLMSRRSAQRDRDAARRRGSMLFMPDLCSTTCSAAWRGRRRRSHRRARSTDPRTGQWAHGPAAKTEDSASTRACCRRSCRAGPCSGAILPDVAAECGIAPKRRR